MPLRMRLIVLIGLVLLVSLVCGGALVGWRAASSVRTELRAALDVGAKTIHNGIDEPGRPDDRAGTWRHLIETFDGNRHVSATLVGERGQPVAVSTLFVPAQPAPVWFRHLIGGELDMVRIPVSRAGDAVILRTDPVNELSEVWAESRDAMLVLAGFAALSALLICAVVGRALRPLENLSNAFEQIGKGNYRGNVPEHGPPELTRLAHGFNDMTRRLAAEAARNRRLNERLLTLQAEERADLARDLHDEIGPLLFAVDMTAATIERLAATNRGSDIPGHVRSIQDTVGRMQRHVRLLLGRLRPVTAIGLEVAIDRLVAFWRGRNPDIVFDVAVSVEEDSMDDNIKETIYRVVQEGMSNAIRHGKPSRIEIAVVPCDPDGIRIQVVDDGIGLPMNSPVGRDPNQLGLVGMRERVMAMAGSLSIRHGHDGRGLALAAWLPRENSLQSHNMDKTE